MAGFLGRRRVSAYPNADHQSRISASGVQLGAVAPVRNRLPLLFASTRVYPPLPNFPRSFVHLCCPAATFGLPHPGGWHALHLGPGHPALSLSPRLAFQPAQRHPIFLTGYRVFMVGAGGSGGGRAVLILKPGPCSRAHFFSSRPGEHLFSSRSPSSGSIPHFAHLNFRAAASIYLALLAGVLAAGMLGLQPTIGSS